MLFVIGNIIFPLVLEERFRLDVAIAEGSIIMVYLIIVRSIPILTFRRILCVPTIISIPHYKEANKNMT